MEKIVFRELGAFTKRIKHFKNEAQFVALAARLREHPDLGDVIPGTNGLRKIRVGLPGRGTRGGARIIYLWSKESNELVFLWLYAKHEAEDLSPKEKRALATIAADIKIQSQKSKKEKGR